MPELRIDDVTARTEAYVHRTKKSMLSLVGQEAAHDQPVVTLQLVVATILLETAGTMAQAQPELTKALLKKEG